MSSVPTVTEVQALVVLTCMLKPALARFHHIYICLIIYIPPLFSFDQKI